jgi:hypothetical protein
VRLLRIQTKREGSFCSRREEFFQVHAQLAPKIMMPDVPKPSDYDLWLQCRNWGTVYPKYETRIEAEISPIKEPMKGPKGKVQKVEKKPKQWTGRGNNARLKGNKWDIKDSELKAELNSGSVLLAYSSNDPTEPVV